MNDSRSSCGCLRSLWTSLGLSMFVEQPSRIALQVYFASLGVMNTAWVIFLVPHGGGQRVPVVQGGLSGVFRWTGECSWAGSPGGRLSTEAQSLSPLDLVILLIAINATIFLMDTLLRSFVALSFLALVAGTTTGARNTLVIAMLEEYFPMQKSVWGSLWPPMLLLRHGRGYGRTNSR